MTRETAVAAGLALPGWRDAQDLALLWDAATAVPRESLVVEIGCFLGRSTIVLADARRHAGAGPLIVVDPLDGRGEPFSAPVYARILAAQGGRTQREVIESALEAAGLRPWADLVELTAEVAGSAWRDPVAMLVLDGDQSPAGAARAMAAWQAYLEPGAVLVLGNSADREYASGHDGNALLLEQCVESGRFELVRRGDTSFLRLTGS